MTRTKRILLSLTLVGAVAAAVGFGSAAFFSDTETSTGNVLRAGQIDLTIDNDSYYGYTIDKQGVWHMLPSPETTWLKASNLDDNQGPGPDGQYLFFNFDDLKPGDLGEDTISVHLTSNPAWVCADLDITRNSDETCTDSEFADDPTCSDPDGEGELSQALNFIFWKDDGDNVLEGGEQVLTQGPASDVLDGASWAIADSQTGDGLPMQPTTELPYYIGKAWCFGDLTENRLPNNSSDGPDVRGPGVTCDGSSVNNAAQTDLLTGDVVFTAVQARNNPDFVCGASKYEVTTGEGWSPVDDARKVWFAKARNNNSNYEFSVGTNDATTDKDTAESTWTEGVDNHFTLSYSAGVATLSIDGHGTVTYPVPNIAYSRIGVDVKAPGVDPTVVKNLVLNSSSISPDSVDTSSGSPWHLLISGDFSGGFTLEGDFVFNDLNGPVQENPAVQFSID